MFVVVAETVTRNTIEAPSTSFVSKPSTVDAIDSTNIPVGISAGEGRTVPPGWKSGDTIETPKDMCLPPVSAAFVKVCMQNYYCLNHGALGK